MFGLRSNKNHDVKQQKKIPLGKVISLMNQKGGVGKTAMAFNLAFAMQNSGKKVLCIDMDPQFNLSLLFGANPEELEFNIHHLLVNSVRELKALHTKAMLSNTVINKDGVDLIPSGQELSGFELTCAGINGARQLILKRFIENNDLLERYDVIIIDGPPTLGLLVVNILCASSGVLFPFVPDSFSEQGLRNIYQVVLDIEDMGITDTPKILGHIPNLFDNRRKQASDDFERIKKMVESVGTVFEPFMNRAPLAKSMGAKKSVFSFDSQEYRALQNQFSDIANHIDNSWGQK